MLNNYLKLGLQVIERNYLDVFPYDKWTGKHIPEFEEGEEFIPTVCELKEGQTTRPNYLTEADLVGLMDKNGIGLYLPSVGRKLTFNKYTQGLMQPLPNIFKQLLTANTSLKGKKAP